MDKVQFNTQIVNTRKTVKRSKVQLIHHLTRQITIFRKKKGSGQQLVKNERRAGRLVKEIEAIKDLAPDEVTMSAVINKESLEAVLGKATSTAEERAVARLIHHKLISSRVASFKDLVTEDLLSIGKKKENKIQRTADYKKRKGLDASSEESEHDGEDDADISDDDDEEHRRAGKMRNSDDDTDGEEEEEEEDDGGECGVTTKASGSGRFTELTLSAQTERLREQMNSRPQKKSNFFLTDDKDDSNSEAEDEAVPSEQLAGLKSRNPKSKELALSSQTKKSKKQANSEPKKKSAFFLTDNDEGQDSNEEEDEEEDEEDSDEEMMGQDDVEEGDEEGEEDDDDDEDESDEETGKSFGAEFRELSAEIRKNERQQGKGGAEQPRKFRSLDLMFVGKLSGSTTTQSLAASGKGQKNRAGQAKRQIINKKKRLEELRRPSSKGSAGRRVALVDMPSLEAKGRDKQPTRIIPGINAPIQTIKTGKDAASEKVLPSQRPLLLALSRRERRERMRLDGSKKGRASGGQDGRGASGAGQGGKGTSETLHPSWEAKKRKKEQESKILPFLGKKIKFDD